VKKHRVLVIWICLAEKRKMREISIFSDATWLIMVVQSLVQ